MTDEDVAELSQLCRSLVTPDLEEGAAQRIAQRARGQLGRGRDPRRIAEPVVASAIVISYGVWVMIEVLKALS